MADAGTDDITCIICSGQFAKQSLALPLDTDVGQSFSKLLSRSIASASEPALLTFIKSPYFRFCFNCHSKVNSIHETYCKLDDLQIKLNSLRAEIVNELLQTYSVNRDPPRTGSIILRNTIITDYKLAIDEECIFDDIKLEPGEPYFSPPNLQKIIDHADIGPDLEPEPLEDSWFSDHGEEIDDLNIKIRNEPRAAPVKRRNELSNKYETIIKPCKIQLGDRIDSPVQSNHKPKRAWLSQMYSQRGRKFKPKTIFSSITQLKKHVHNRAVNESNSEPTYSIVPVIEEETNCGLSTARTRTNSRPDSLSISEKDDDLSPSIPEPDSDHDFELESDYINSRVGKYQCPRPNCSSRPFSSNYQLRRHLKRKHKLCLLPLPRSIFYPERCQRTGCNSKLFFKSSRQYRSHMRRKHREGLKRQKPMVSSWELHPETLVFPTKCPRPKCKVRNKLTFDTLDQLQNHFESYHRKPAACLEALNKEMRTYTNKFPTRCLFQGCEAHRVFELPQDLRRHLRTIHLKKPKTVRPEPTPEELTCPTCDRQFRSRNSLIHHQRQKHQDPVVNSTCEICGAGFTTSWGLKNHAETHHAPVTPFFLCSQCPKSFKNKRGLDNHMRRHNGEMKYTCRVCPKGYLFRLDVEDHERYCHWEVLGLQEIKCKECGKVCSRTGQLRSHMKRHTGEQRFACQECEYKTDQPNDMREHVATVHESEARFECAVCRKKFKLERRLRQHSLEHEDECKNACQTCGKRFATARTLRIHNERKHGLPPNANFIDGDNAESIPMYII